MSRATLSPSYHLYVHFAFLLFIILFGSPRDTGLGKEERYSNSLTPVGSSESRRSDRVAWQKAGGETGRGFACQCESKNIQERGASLPAASPQLAPTKNGLDLWHYKL
jgi:hypothetical protein